VINREAQKITMPYQQHYAHIMCAGTCSDLATEKAAKIALLRRKTHLFFHDKMRNDDY